ncbi:MAG TPA: hypothetical protein VK027_05130 [Chitinophagaceae bacterium]|nr:hypothetical protein [Chitinophagaceae bacterium]
MMKRLIILGAAFAMIANVANSWELEGTNQRISENATICWPSTLNWCMRSVNPDSPGPVVGERVEKNIPGEGISIGTITDIRSDDDGNNRQINIDVIDIEGNVYNESMNIE